MITVNDLVANKGLQLSYKAGTQGGEKLINWAHAVDLPDPWNWVSAGNLVMTTGAGIPVNAKEQVEWITRLIASNASALVITPRSDAANLTRDLLDIADEHNFPILVAHFKVKLACIARIVIESSMNTRRDQLEAGHKLFQAYALSLHESLELNERLENLGRRQSWNMIVSDIRSHQIIAASSKELKVPDNVQPLEVPGRSHVLLYLWHHDEKTIIDPLLAHYLNGLIGIEMERQMIECDRQRQEGEKLFKDILSGDVDYRATKAILMRRNLENPLVNLAIEVGGPAKWTFEDIHYHPVFRNSFPLILAGQPDYITLPDNEDMIGAVVEAFGPATKIGVSQPVTLATGFVESTRQAKIALSQAKENSCNIMRYGTDGQIVSLFPKTVSETRDIVEHFLGKLIDYDKQNHTSLLQTLDIFIAQDCNWKAAAYVLGIHRQTLIYRIHLIEQLTGLKPNSSQGTATFWLALKAGKTAGILP